MSAATSKDLGIVLAHGGFHLPSCFDLAIERFKAAGFSPVIAVRHPSIGTDTKITCEDDGRNIQEAIAPYLYQGKEFLGISHSYGGTPLTIAAKGNSVAERAVEGKKGGFRAVVYVTSNMPPTKGGSALSVIPPVDIVDVAEGIAKANVKARAAFYGPDMADELADKFLAACLPQSLEALAGPSPVGLDELKTPAYYILCEKDQTIPAATQEQIISTIPTLKRVLRNPGGHCAFITELDLFVEQIFEIAAEA
ncbi:hypothetical protein AK830_g434 [Neonectria ditissima]|uniref:AB hydrolase-1 domain-containing protein n=1 Tax=Neonectria ditissima TaxID=78410 RepID=A0A0P7B7E9_9HYPO|nr:hypothetical protein AK830_g434 [Neonectria ditissima]